MATKTRSDPRVVATERRLQAALAAIKAVAGCRLFVWTQAADHSRGHVDGKAGQLDIYRESLRAMQRRGWIELLGYRAAASRFRITDDGMEVL